MIKRHHTPSAGVEDLPAQRVRATDTRALLSCGVIAGPLFLVIWAFQAMTRDGFDPSRHPISLLSLGGAGWIQTANFMLAGGLIIAAAVGVRRTMAVGIGRGWGPLLIGLFGLGLVIAGAFPTDAGAGFPAGAPDGAPEWSWHGVMHQVGFAVATVSWIAACLVFARRRHGTARFFCCAAPVLAILMIAWPDPTSLSLRLVAATAVEFGVVAALSMSLLRETGDRNDDRRRVGR